jgi:hypothetical protein
VSDPWGPRPPEPPSPFPPSYASGQYPSGPYGSGAYPAGPGDARPGGRRPWQVVLRGELVVVGVMLAAGLLLAGVWALAAPGLAEAADPGESRMAVDGLLALLQIGAGIVTAVGLVVLPGRDPVARLVAVLVGATAAGLLAVPVGAARGLHLQAPGAALLWPLLAALLTALRMLAGLLLAPDGDGGPRRRRRA